MGISSPPISPSKATLIPVTNPRIFESKSVLRQMLKTMEEDVDKRVQGTNPLLNDGLEQLLSVDFNELEKSWQRFAFDPLVKQAIASATISNETLSDTTPENRDILRRRDSILESYINEVDQELVLFETQSVDDYVKSCKDLLLLHDNVRKCDTILIGLEEKISSFQNTLEDISSKIERLQSESLQISVKVSNRRAAHDLISTFSDQILATPQLIHDINEAPLDEQYLSHLQLLAKKLEHAAQPGVQELNSTMESLFELEKLKFRAVQRIREFLYEKIAKLKQPKTNIQIIQRNVLAKVRHFYHFLVDHHPETAEEIKNMYISILEKLYVNQFRSYTQSCNRLVIELSGNVDLLGLKEVGNKQPRLHRKGTMGSIFGLGNSSSNSAFKGKLFSLNNRDAIFSQLDADPIVASAIPTDQNATLFFESIFQAFQRLVIDTATSEYLFLSDFFTSDGASNEHLFDAVTAKALEHAIEHIETYLSSSNDIIGALLLLKINDHNRVTMTRRSISCLDGYFDILNEVIVTFFFKMFDTNINSLKAATPKQYMNIPASQNTHPHYLTRRYTELFTSLSVVGKHLNTPALSMEALFASLESSFIIVLNLLSKELNQLDSVVFLINNYDFILSVFSESKVKEEFCHAYSLGLQNTIASFIETQSMSVFYWLISYVRSAEEFIENQKSKLPPEQLAAELDVNKMENVVMKFQEEWKTGLHTLQSKVMSSFTSFSNGLDILKKLLTQVLLYYTRFQQIISKCFPRQPQPIWTKHIVPTNTILSEIRKYSNAI